MSLLADYKDQIQLRCPDLAVRTAALNPDGQYNDVLVVNDAHIFRFAKVRPAIETLRREVHILHRLQGRLPLPIPNPVFVSPEGAGLGEAFMGYPLIPGQPLWREAFQAIRDESGLSRMAGQLADFLQILHSLPADEIVPPGQPVADSLEDMQALYARIREKLYGHMRPDAKKAVTAHFEDFFAQAQGTPAAPALRHGDFGTGNLLHDPDTLSLTGVIDFSFTGPGDPAADFAGLYVSYGEEFYRRCSAIYPALEAALDRVHFYRGIFALEEALFGLENDDDEAFRSGMEAFV